MRIPTSRTPLGWALGLAVTLLGPLAGAREGEAAPPADIETRVYDLRGVLPDLGGEHRFLEVLPFRLDHDYRDDHWDLDTWEDSAELTEQIVVILEEVVAPDEFSYEHRELHVIDDFSLLITAPTEIHAAAQELIDGIGALNRRVAVLEIDVFELGANSGVLEVGNPAALIEAAGTNRISHQEVALHVGLTHVQSSTRTISFLRGWEAEIAQGSGIGQPIVEELETGTDWLLRVEDDHASGAYRLRAVQKSSELLHMGGGDYNAQMLIRLDSAMTERPANGRVDQPEVGVSTTVFSRALAVGGTTVTVSAVETSMGTLRYATRYRLVSADPRPPVLPLGPDGSVALMGMDLSGTIWRPMQAPEVDRHRLWPTHRELEGDQLAIQPIAFPSTEADSDHGLERAHEVLWDQGGVHLFSHGALLVMVGDPALAQLLPKTVAPFQSSASPASADVLVTGRNRSGGPARVLGRVVLPVDGAGSSLALTGVASLALHGYDVDVAQDVSLPEPRTLGYLDGLSVRAEAIGGRDVAVDVLLHRLVDRETLDANADAIGDMDRLSFDSVRLQPVLPRRGAVVTYRDVGTNGDDTVVDITVRITTP